MDWTPGAMGSALRLLDSVSVHCDCVRQQLWSEKFHHSMATHQIIQADPSLRHTLTLGRYATTNKPASGRQFCSLLQDITVFRYCVVTDLETPLGWKHAHNSDTHDCVYTVKPCVTELCVLSRFTSVRGTRQWRARRWERVSPTGKVSRTLTAADSDRWRWEVWPGGIGRDRASRNLSVHHSHQHRRLVACSVPHTHHAPQHQHQQHETSIDCSSSTQAAERSSRLRDRSCFPYNMLKIILMFMLSSLYSSQSKGPKQLFSASSGLWLLTFM